MVRPNHEFSCSVAPSPGFKNRVEMTCNMQQEGLGFVFLPLPASLVRAPVLPCVGAPPGESSVLLADTGAKPTGTAGAHVPGGGKKGLGWQLHEV